MLSILLTDCIVITDFSYITMYNIIEQIYNNYKNEIHMDNFEILQLLKGATKYKIDNLIRRIEKVFNLFKYI